MPYRARNANIILRYNALTSTGYSKNSITAMAIEMRSRMNRTYLGGALQRIPVDGDGIVRHFLDAANEANRVLCIWRRRAVGGDNQRGLVSCGTVWFWYWLGGIAAKKTQKKCEKWKESKRWLKEARARTLENMFVLTIKEISALPSSDKCLMSYV